MTDAPATEPTEPTEPLAPEAQAPEAQPPTTQELPPQAPAAQPPAAQPPTAYGGYPVVPYGTGPVGKVRGTGVAILLTIVTFGIYSLYWFYSVHEELKRHRGTGLGGVIAFVLAFFVGFVMPYITSSEVGDAYAAKGEEKPVSGLTGLWYFPGMLILIGPIVWFVKTNGAINRYWRSQGAV